MNTDDKGLGTLEYKANGRMILRFFVQHVLLKEPGLLIVASGNVKQKAVRALHDASSVTIILNDPYGQALFSKVIPAPDFSAVVKSKANHIIVDQPIGLS